MKNRTCKIIAGIVAMVFVAVVALPMVAPGRVDAKWFSWSRPKINKVATTQEVSSTEQEVPLEEEAAVTNEVVITDKNGKVEHVAIIEHEEVAKALVIDKKDAEELQKTADSGHQPWLLDPVQVVQNYAAKYGFDAAKDIFTLTYQVYKGKYSGTGEAGVLVEHGRRYYMVDLIQPAGSGNDKIWQIHSIKEVKVKIKKSPNVAPGVDGLDYSEIVKWQQNVDGGRELWRLDPLQVAQNEGKAYGFTASDVFIIVKRLNSSTLSSRGEIHVKVMHEGIEYTMVLVRPIGSDSGAIWTTHHVIGKDVKPLPQSTAKILFKTNKFEDWKWYTATYPKDMAFATIVDYEAQLKNDKRIPEHVLEKVKDIDYSSKVVLFVYLGTGPSGGYGIGIEKVTMEGNNMTVKVRTKSPAPNEVVTKAITFPADFVTIKRSEVDIWGGVNVTFVDQDGKVLSKNKLVISHR